VFCPFVTSLHAVDTLIPAKLLKKCYKVGSIGPLYSKMPLNFARRALYANSRKDLKAKHDVLNLILQIELFDVGALTLWVHFLIHLKTNIYWLL